VDDDAAVPPAGEHVVAERPPVHQLFAELPSRTDVMIYKTFFA
jgi:hypothetical protein